MVLHDAFKLLQNTNQTTRSQKTGYQNLCAVVEMLRPVTYPLPGTGKQISVAAEAEAKAEQD